jgi:hypothetical protein
MDVELNLAECFVCNKEPVMFQGETAGSWIKPRVACPEHVRLAALRNDRRLVDIVERTLPNGHPLEGSGLNVVLNPLAINGQKAWASFAAGGYVIVEEIYPSVDFCEFVAQHVAWAIDVLFAMHKQRAILGGAPGFMDLYIGVLKEESDPGRFQNNLDKLCRCWDSWQQVQKELTKRGKVAVDSPTEAIEVFEASFATTDRTGQKDVKSCTDKLLKIAESRFAHL